MNASVFFFGGYNSTQSHINLWLSSAQAQQPNVDFTGFPWPNYTRRGLE
jgi:hypothetical protein